MNTTVDQINKDDAARKSNTADEAIKALVEENRHLKYLNERYRFKVRAQRQEISRLNKANIVKLHLIRKREDAIDELQASK